MREKERESEGEYIVIGGEKRKRDRGKQKFLSAMTLLYKVTLWRYMERKGKQELLSTMTLLYKVTLPC